MDRINEIRLLQKGRAQGLVVALVASIFVLFPVSLPTATAAVTLNDGICNLAGAGSSANPYQVSNPDELYESADCATNTSRVIKLMNDIDLSSSTNSPIGYFGPNVPGKRFAGTFDGGGFKIFNILISTSDAVPFAASASGLAGNDSNGVGLFWGVSTAGFTIATFQNLTLEGVVSYLGAGVYPTGAIIGLGPNRRVSISNVVVDVDVTGHDDVGGFIGHYQGELDPLRINSSSNKGTISGRNSIGGFVGYLRHVLTASDLINEGSISGSGNMVGGLIGKIEPTSTSPVTLSNVTNRGEIDAASRSGGLIGYARVEGLSVASASNEASVSSGDRAGGLIGEIQGRTSTSVTVSYVSNSGAISGMRATGGLLGFVWDPINSLVLELSTNAGLVSGSEEVGGLLGFFNSSLTQTRLDIKTSSNHATVSATVDDIGGILGQSLDPVELVALTNSGRVTGLTAANVGGIAGRLDPGGTLSDLVNTGIVEGLNYTGGILGFLDDSDAKLSVTTVRNQGSVSALQNYAGGIVGQIDGNVTASNVVNAGNVQAQNYLGGFTGDHDATSFDVQSFSNLGQISSSTGRYIGGLVGFADGSLSLLRAHFSGSIVGFDRVGGVIGESENTVAASEVLVSGRIDSSGTPIAEVGGIVGYLDGLSALITNSLVISEISASGTSVGGFLGDTGNNAVATFSNVLFAGKVNATNLSNVGAIYGGDGIAGQSFANSSYWALAQNSDLAAAPSTASFGSVATSFLNTTSARSAASYVGWDFVNVWAFGPCAVNNGLPTLRFAEPLATSSTGLCVDAAPASSGPIGSGKPYEGPIIQSVSPTLAVNQPAQVTGIRLNTITEVFVGGQKVSFTLSNGVLTFQAPSLSPGRYQVVFYAPIAQINLFGNIDLVGSAATSPARVNVGSFNGKLVVYASNLAGAQISWKVGGRWGKATATSNFARFDRPTPRKGVTVNVQIFVNGKLELTKAVRTR